MIININDGIFFKSFDDKSELKKEIISFIFNSKTSDILYKGDSSEINYKTLKKIVKNKETMKKILKQFNIEYNNNDNLKSIYLLFIENIKSKYCLIYKDKKKLSH